jgi:DNA-binding CsgD family transcriptional regulator
MDNQLPAGLLNHHYEFFAGPDLHGYCLTSGQVVHFDDFDEQLLIVIELQIAEYPIKVRAIHEMGITGRINVIRQFLVCNYGGFDHLADMIDGQLQATEYWPCPKRSTCAFNGIICDGVKTATGEFLSPREIQVTKLIAAGHLDKEIGLHLNIKLNTVTTHTKNIRRKTGLYRKADITGFAYKNNIVS